MKKNLKVNSVTILFSKKFFKSMSPCINMLSVVEPEEPPPLRTFDAFSREIRAIGRASNADVAEFYESVVDFLDGHISARFFVVLHMNEPRPASEILRQAQALNGWRIQFRLRHPRLSVDELCRMLRVPRPPVSDSVRRRLEF